jgi:isopentenyl phosphate kinase
MIFLKLGGSLITDKAQERVARLETINRLAVEIAEYSATAGAEPLLLGHGSGSFGHMAAARHQTHLGASSPEEWHGFSQVWAAAAELNQHVLRSLTAAGLPALSFPPSASALCRSGQLVQLAVTPVAEALKVGLLPVVYGDVAFDEIQGAAIVSTEELFAYLAAALNPDRILLAGLEAGIYRDYPARRQLLQRFRPTDLESGSIAGAAETDVTGGMLEKVNFALDMKKRMPALEIQIFSGDEPSALTNALSGERVGTLVEAD